MKINKIIWGCSILALGLIFTNCKKDLMYKPTAQFEFVNSGAKYVSGDVTVNPKDSIFFQFNVSSTADMKRIIFRKGATSIDTAILNSSNKNSFSATKKLVADSVPGVYTYMLSAYDSTGYPLGSKSIIVTVSADFKYYTAITLFAPDTTAKTNKTYYSVTTNKTYGFNEGAANGNAIDFGFYYDTTAALKHTLYALPANPVSFYDISSWTKNATIFKKITTSFTSFTSSGALRTAGLTNLASGATAKVTALAAGNIYAFKTVAGKYGVILITYINASSPAASTYMNIEVKIQQ